MAGRIVHTFWLRDRQGKTWPVPDHLKHEAVTFPGNTGAALAGRYFPHPQPRGLVVLVHPDKRYAQHWFIKTGWVDFLHERGFSVLTFDLTGYGASRGPATYYHEDVAGAVAYAQNRAPGLRTTVIGVSMGAFAVANASPNLANVDAIVLESPYPSFQSWYGKGFARFGSRLFDRMFPATARAIDAERNIADAAPKRVLIVAGAEDAVTPVGLTRSVAAAAPRERTTYLELARGDHLQLFPGDGAYLRALEAVMGP